MRYILVAIPESPQPGVPADPPYGGVVLGPLPEGTYRMEIQAHWSLTGDDGRFRGGTISLAGELGSPGEGP